MNFVERFHAAWVLETGWHGLELLPTALARAAAQVLPVAAVGLSLISHGQRIPLGASSAEAAAAERWQFTLGAGPCFTAVATGAPVVADETTLRQQWPVLHDQLIREASFHATVAVPLGRKDPLGAVELYFDQPQPGPDFDLTQAQVVADLTHTVLQHTTLLGAAVVPSPDALEEVGDQLSKAGSRDPFDPMSWLDSVPARARQKVWVAVGICMVTLELSTADALALLRAHAYARARTLDEAADDLISRRLPVEALQEPDAS